MANIRQRMDLVERVMGELERGEMPSLDIEEILDGADYQLHIIETVLQQGGDSDAPICCYKIEDDKIGCGRYQGDEYVMDIVAPLEEFVEYCKDCRGTLQDKLPGVQGKVERARALYNLPLEEIFEDMEKLHLAQRAIDDLHTPITCNEELEELAREILPYAQSLSHYDGQFESGLKKVYFALGKNDCSTYLGGGWIRIAQSSSGQSSLYVELAHELNHFLLGVFGANESTVMILGLETNALMAQEGDKNHEISICRIMKNLAAYTAYIKARREDQVERWRDFMPTMFPGDLVEETEEAYKRRFNEEWGDGSTFKTPLSHYMLVPYLALKEAMSEGRNHIPQSNIFEVDMEVPALTRLLRSTLA